MSSKTALTRAAITSVQSAKEILEIEAVKDNWINTYQKVSGKNDGILRYEAEKILFMQNYQANQKAFDKCDKFSIYASFVELSISGLTLRDGISYIIPYGDKATFLPGWKGRLEQISEMQNVVHVHQPQVVYDCDQFELSKGMSTIINKHIPAIPRTEGAKITGVYMVIQFVHGPVVYWMDAADVLNIRNNYSQSFKQYQKDIADPNVVDGKIKKKYKDQNTGEWKEYDKVIEKPMWVSDEAQAFKKTLVKRVYNDLPKLPKHKLLDERLNSAAINLETIEEKVEMPAAQLGEEELNNLIDDVIDNNIIDADHEVIDTTTGEVIQKEENKKTPSNAATTKAAKKIETPATQENDEDEF